MKSYLLVDLAFYVAIADANYYYTECEMIKLLHEFSKSKRYMDINNNNELHTCQDLNS